MKTNLTAKQKSLLVLGALVLIFIGPMIAAWSLYTINTPVLQTINYGELLEPPLALNDLALTNSDKTVFPNQVLAGHWILLYFTPTACDKLCEQNLYNLRQVRLALGKDQTRVQRLFVTYAQLSNSNLEKMIEQQYTGTLFAVITAKQLQGFLGRSDVSAVVQQQGGVFLADPHGNVILYYQPNMESKKLLKDLTRLLKVSQIG